LTIKGVTRPVEITAHVSEPNVDPFGRERVGITLEAKVDRNEYGVSWNAPNQGGGNYLGDDVTIKADLALIRQES
jgi:polyisoprenoid-binding protein YceI